MSATNTLETNLLELIFNKTLPSYLGTLSGTGDVNFYLALFTADPTEAGTLTNECAYGNYARVAVVRTSGGWTVSGNQATNTALVQFVKSTSTGADAKYVGVMSGGTIGAGTMLVSLQLTTDTPTTTGIQPQFDAGTLVFTVD
jgi:hypothetical protein